MVALRCSSILAAFALSVLSCVQSPPLADQTPDDDADDSQAHLLPALTEPPAFAPDDALIPAPALGGTPLLNEVRYQPAEGDTQFVELKGTTAADLAAGLVLRNEYGDTFAIPASAAPADANGIITIFFDGQAQIIGDVVHAAITNFLKPESGFLILEVTGVAQLDGIAWGNEPGSVRMHGTGLIIMPDGISLARRPQSIAAAQSEDWYVAAPIDVTPGKPNRNLGARMLFPLDGALITADDVKLDWAFVHTAAQFEVQVATDAEFAHLVFDEMVIDGPVSLAVSTGGYYWRVQAVFADGSRADWSPIRRLLVVETIPLDSVPVEEEPTAKSILPRQAAIRRNQLSHPVPMYFQHKDSHMLLLESDGPSGTRHPWDGPHPQDMWMEGSITRQDPADNTNCALAAISMVNAYFWNSLPDAPPKLTQDRIGFHIHTKTGHPDAVNYPGPEFDLNFDTGNEPQYYHAGLEFAFGGAKIPYSGFNVWQAGSKLLNKILPLGAYPTDFRDQFWKALGDSIAADKPVPFAIYNGPITFDSHALVAWRRLVVDGFRFVMVNDPWCGVKCYPLDQMFVFEYWIIPDGVSPAQDEEELRNRTDTDNDGIMDFEERERFKTDWQNPDTDGDCVDDLAEVRASVFDSKHGWGQYWTKLKKKLTVNSDGSARKKAPEKQPELDGDGEATDSDEGGLPDPLEDLNLNGKYEPELGETNIFDPSDDARTIRGHYQYTEDTVDGFTHFERSWRFEYELEVKNGEIKGKESITRNEKNTKALPGNPDGDPARCDTPPRTVITTMHELKFNQDVKALVRCQALEIVGDPYLEHSSQPADIIDPCCSGCVGEIRFLGTFMGQLYTREPTSIGNGKVVYKYSEEPVHGPSRIGTYLHEWEITLEKK